MMKKEQIILITLVVIAIAALTIPNIPIGNRFNENNHVMRMVIFDVTTSRTSHSFTIDYNNRLTIESGKRRVNIMRFIRTLGTEPEGRLNLVRRGIFIENNPNIAEITLEHEEVENVILLLNNLNFDRPPQIGHSQDIMAGTGGTRWGVILYFDGVGYETILRDIPPHLEPLRDVIYKVVELSGVTINLPARN